MIDYEHDISAIDAALLRHGMASIHLLRAGDEAALVDCGTGHSLPNVLAALARGEGDDLHRPAQRARRHDATAWTAVSVAAR